MSSSEKITSITLQVRLTLLSVSVCVEFYEEMLCLVHGLTSTAISPKMWEVYPLLEQMFKADGFDYFTGV